MTFLYKNFFTYIKTDNNSENSQILSKNNKRLQKKTHERYQNFSEEEKEKNGATWSRTI